MVEGVPPLSVRQQLEAHPERAREYSFQRSGHRVLISIREDFLYGLEPLRNEIPSLIHNRYRIGLLGGPRALEVIIQAPRPEEGSRGAGLTADRGPLVDARAAELIVRTVASSQIDQRPLETLEVEPALLSIMCAELAHLRPRGAPITSELVTGSRSDIIATFYERALAGAPPSVRSFVEDQLVTATGYRTSAVLAEALTVPGFTSALLENLITARLLRVVERPNGKWLELTHDILTEIAARCRIARHERERVERAAREEDIRGELRARRIQRLRRTWLSGAGLVLLAAMTLFFFKTRSERVALLQRLRQQRERDAAAGEKQRALMSSLLAASSRAISFSDIRGLASGLRNADEQERAVPELRDANIFLLSVILHSGWPRLVSETNLPLPVRYLATSPSGAYFIAERVDNSVSLLSSDGRFVGDMPMSSAMEWFDFDANDGRVLLAGEEGDVGVWDVSPLQLVARLPLKLGIASIDLSPNGKFADIIASDGRVMRWNVDNGDVVVSPTRLGPDPVIDNMVSGDRSPMAIDTLGGLAIAARDPVLQSSKLLKDSSDSHWMALQYRNKVLLFDTVAHKYASAVLPQDDIAEQATFANASDALAIRGRSGRVYVRTVPELKPVGLPIDIGDATKFALVGTKKVLVRGKDQKLSSFLVESGGPLFREFGEPGMLATASSLDSVCTASQGMVRVWSTRAVTYVPTELDTKIEGLGPVSFINVSGKEEVVALNITQASLFRWDVPGGGEIGKAVDVGGGGVNVGDFFRGDIVPSEVAHDGKWVMTAHHGRASVYYLEDHRSQELVDAGATQIRAMAQSWGGSMIAAGFADGSFRVWRMPEAAIVQVGSLGVPIMDLQIDSGRDRLVALLKDTSIVASQLSGSGSTTRLVAPSGASAIRICRDGSLLAGIVNATVFLWRLDGVNVRSAGVIAPDSVADLALDPACSRLAAVVDGAVQLWDISTGLPLGMRMRGPRSVTAVSFSDDGLRVVCETKSGAPIMWDTPTGGYDTSSFVSDLALVFVGYPGRSTEAKGVSAMAVLDRIRRGVQPAADGADSTASLVKWFLGDPDAAVRSPFADRP